MNQIVMRLWAWFWHLLPANPILVRVVHGASRRTRHLWLRVGYLSVLLLVVLFSMVASMSGRSASLSELAKGASQTFAGASMAQLALMCFLAPVFTAAAITQERDAQTFNILLSTPLTSAQIVFGSLMSRLYFVIMLLIAGLPIFLMTMVYGGVTTTQIVQSFALSASTAVLTGALAIFVAMSAIGTRRTIYSFYLVIALYLLCVYLLGQWDKTWIESSPTNIAGEKMSWLAPLHPFLALDVSLNRVYAPPVGRLGEYGAIARYALAHPPAAYMILTTSLAIALTFASILFVRRGAKVGEPNIFTPLTRLFRSATAGDRTRPPRTVWANPVAWREAKTRATSGGGMRWITTLAGLIGSVIVLVWYVNGDLTAREVPMWIAAVTIVQFAVALIIATNTAATSMTKEKEARSMDLLLTTPLTSKYILWGKLRGLVSFTAPLLVGPMVVLLMFGVYGLMRNDTPPAVWIETGIELGVLLVIYTALACVLGLRVSLSSRKNVTAVMYSLGLLILLCGLLTAGGFALVNSAGGEFGAVLAPFTPFTSIKFLIDPSGLFGSPKEFVQGAASARTAAMVGSSFAACLYALIAWRSYTALVRDFDMTMRKQSGS